MTNTSQPLTDKEQEFLEEYTTLGRDAFLTVVKAANTLHEKFGIHPNEATRMLLASIITTGAPKNCSDEDILVFALDLFHDIINQWRSLGKAEGSEQFPLAKMYPEASRLSDLEPEAIFNTIESLKSLTPNLAALISESTDVIANRFNVCGYELYLTFLLNIVAKALINTSNNNEEAFEDQVAYFTTQLNKAWEYNQETIKQETLPN